MKRTVFEFPHLVLATVLILGACSTGRPFQPQDGGPEAGSGGGAGKGTGGAAGGTGGHAGGGAGGHAGTGGAAGSGGATDGGAKDSSGPGLGHSCSSGTDCGSGFCVQGVCCSSSCTDSCYACTNALTGSSPDGTCAVVSQGLADPAGGCATGTTALCGNTGHCDGKGACEKFGSSTVCLAASCGGGGFTSSSACDGKGTCTPGTTTDCKGFSCSATTGCATKCSTDGDCPGGYCTSTMTCATTLSDGSTCSKNSQCTHANCISGICCATICTGTCMTCATGLCKPVASGGSSAGACAVDPTACGHDGTCDGNSGCRYAMTSVSCGAVSCSGGQLTPTGLCNGAGTCSTPAAAACSGGVVCASTNACKPSTCTADADCGSGLCQSGACAGKRSNGQACTATDQCTSGFCANGVCCGSACTGTCQACTNKLTGSSPDGTCAAVSQGLADPAGGCAAGTAGSCGNTGHCDGKGACERFGSSTVCLAASCGSSGYTSASTCNGMGTCTPGTTTGCKGFSCSATTGCATSCSADTDCPGGYCTSAMTCSATMSDGSTCSKNSQCAHGNCILGICCATTCTGTCLTCATGLCKPVAAGGSSAGACGVDSTACGHDGTCDGNGGCRYAISSVSCGTPSCGNAQLTPIGNCNGSGTCTAGTAAACANNLICASGTACKTSCSADTDCVSSAYCSSGSCLPKKSNGSTCGAPDQCSSTICAPDGICCNRACANSCEACDNAGSVGTCSPVQSGPVHGNRMGCFGGGTACAGSCMGLTSGLCSYPTNSCGSATCSGTQIVPTGTCNGNGSCSVPAAQNCSGGYTCSAGACQTTCSTSAGCLSDYFCYANACHEDVVSISAGTDHTCAALKDGRVYCWGESTYGALGNGSTVDTIVLSPVRAGTFNDAVSVSMGSYSSYALTSSGTIRDWGRGQSGELGTGALVTQPSPVMVATSSGTLTGVTRVVGGNSFGCATTSSGIYCWGPNDAHGLGVDAVTSATATAIPYASLVMGYVGSPTFFGGTGFHVAVSGTTVCPWGTDNGYQEITAASGCNVACYSAPSNCFTVGGTVDMMAAGYEFACVKYGPNIQCWGENDEGAITGPTSTASVAPPGNFISGLSPTPIDMQSFGTGACALLNDGIPTLKCWGYPFSDNASGSSPPVTFSFSLPSGVKIKSLGAGDSATACFITDEGSPWCWGSNTYGTVGNGTQGNTVPNPAEVLVNW